MFRLNVHSGWSQLRKAKYLGQLFIRITTICNVLLTLQGPFILHKNNYRPDQATIYSDIKKNVYVGWDILKEITSYTRNLYSTKGFFRIIQEHFLLWSFSLQKSSTKICLWHVPDVQYSPLICIKLQLSFT